jgi:hypothetical protein
MGTSSPYGGHKDRNPLAAPDYDDPGELDFSTTDQEPAPTTIDPAKQETPWRNAKSAFSNHIRRDPRFPVNKVMQAYERASGSVKGLLRSSNAGIAAGNALAQFVSNAMPSGSDLSKRINDIVKSGGDIKIVLSKLSDALSPTPDDKESAVAREAITNTMCRLSDYVDANNLDISSFERMDQSLQGHLLSAYVIEYIWGKMMNDFQSRIEEKISSVDQASQIENEYKDYIRTAVDAELHKTLGAAQAKPLDAARLFANCYEALFNENL